MRPELARQRLRQHREARLGGAVHRVALQRPEGVDVDHVEHQSAPQPQLRGGGLDEEQRRAQVGADQVVEGARGDLAERRRIEGRGVVVAGLVLLGLFVVASLVEHWLRVLNVRCLSPRIVPLPLIQVSRK